MTIQRGALLPEDLGPTETVRHIAGLDHAALARQLYEQGFDPIELSGDLPLFVPHSLGPPAVERLAALQAETGLDYTVHLPLWSVELSTPLAPVREGSVRALVETIRNTLPLHPEVYVTHATGSLAAEFYFMKLPQAATTALMRQFQSNAADSIRTILAETGLPSRRLAIETVKFPLDLTLELAEQLDLSLCLDIGHVLLGFPGPVDLFEALEQCLPRLAEVHLHDAPQHKAGEPLREGEDHQALGRGDLDVARLLDRLAEAGFDGPVIFEISPEEALASKDRIAKLRPQALNQRGTAVGGQR
jgi:sugar phosphate isomerase/epimerase